MPLKLAQCTPEHWKQVRSWGALEIPPHAFVAIEDGALAGALSYCQAEAAPYIFVLGIHAHPALDGESRDEVAAFLRLQALRLGVMTGRAVLAAGAPLKNEGPPRRRSGGGADNAEEGSSRKDRSTKTYEESLPEEEADVNIDWLEG